MLRVVALWAFALAVHGCGGGPQPPPEPGESQGVIPDLSGVRVMVFPVQDAALPGDSEAELGFALKSRAPAVTWILPDELRAAARGSPGYDVVVEGLPVGIFLQAEVRRVGDPLYGYLRRLGALVDADAAVIPILLRYRVPSPEESPRDPSGGGREVEAAPQGRAEVTSVLVSLVSGRVHWFGIVEGEPGEPTDPAVLASTLDALARRLGTPGAR